MGLDRPLPSLIYLNMAPVPGAFYLGLVEMSTLPLNIHEYYAHAAKVRGIAAVLRTGPT